MNLKWCFILLMSMAILHACSNEGKEDLNTELQNAGDHLALMALETKLDSMLKSSPNEDGGLWYGKLAQRSLDLSRNFDAENFLLKGIRGYSDSKETPANLLQLANIYQNYLDLDQAGSAICCILSSRTEGKMATKASQCCRKTDTSLDSALVALRDSVFNPYTEKINIRMARTYIAMGQARALLIPDDDLSADHLNEIAKVAKAIKDPQRAIFFYDWILEDYRHTPYGPKAMFLKAFTFENDLGDLSLARSAYTEYINEWPKDEFVDDAQFLLLNLGKDPEQIIEEIKNRKVN